MVVIHLLRVKLIVDYQYYRYLVLGVVISFEIQQLSELELVRIPVEK